MTIRLRSFAVVLALMSGIMVSAAFAVETQPSTSRHVSTQKAATRLAATQRTTSTSPATAATRKVELPVVTLATTKKSGSTIAASIPAQMRVNLAWQIALEAADFSPGILDGHFGRKSQMALTEYAARFFPGKDKYDPAVFLSLNVNVDEAVTSYTITVDDAARIGPLPDDWNEKAKLDRLTYDTMIDYMAEKFHCTRALLQTLNPNLKLNSLTVDQTLNVPNLRPFPVSAATQSGTSKRVVEKADRLEINLSQKTLRVYDKANTQIALFHCSVAKDKAKLPDRDAVVKNIAINPEYKFDPKYWPEVNNVDRILIIKPGPRNPVGSVWIGLDLPGYGIHGNPKPELIGKTGSHGCFRLTNWDAMKLISVVKVGMPVRMINPEREGQPQEDKD